MRSPKRKRFGRWAIENIKGNALRGVPLMLLLLLLSLGLFACTAPGSAPQDENAPYLVDVAADSRSASFENPRGDKSGGGKAPHPALGPGRKGSPLKVLKPGQQETLCDLQGAGVIRHIWVTTNNTREALLKMVVRAYWEDQTAPSSWLPPPAPCAGAEAGGRQWESIGARSVGQLVTDRPLGVDLLEQLYGPREKSYAFAHQYIFSPINQTLPVRLFTSDGCRAWINRQAVFESRDLHREYMMETFDVHLLRGWNSLLLEVRQGTAGWSFAARIDERVKKGLKYSPEKLPLA